MYTEGISYFYLDLHYAIIFSLHAVLQLNLTEWIFGRIEVVPSSMIVLDKSNCTSPIIVPIFPTPSPPIPPPANMPQSCHDFFEIISNAASKPFICAPMDKCERGITCQLDILDTYYLVNISLTISNDVIFTVGDGPADRLISNTTKQSTSVSLPKPEEGSIIFELSILGGKQPTAGIKVHSQ